MTRTIVIECPDCGGTGLYKGKNEKGTCAVVCFKCNGTGKTEFTYNEFEGRKEMNDVTRVFGASFGYVHYDCDHVTDEGETLHFSQYGCSYEDWKNGAVPAPMEELYCPNLCSLLYGFKGLVTLPSCLIGCRTGSFTSIPLCSFLPKKEQCWEEWHKKYGQP